MLLRKRISNYEVVLQCSDRNAEAAASVLEEVEKRSNLGAAIHPGMQIQFGWSVLTLSEENTDLRICEPDFLHDVSQLSRSIDVTLDVLRAQIGLLRATNDEGEDIRYDQEITVNPEAFSIPDVFLKRDRSDFSGDSGWFLGKLDDLEAARPANDLTTVKAFELLRLRPLLMHPLVLSEGFLVIVRGDVISAVLDRDLRPRMGSYSRK